MKIRTNFVTNSSSYSSAEIKIDNPVLLEILKRYSDLGAFIRDDGVDLSRWVGIGLSESEAKEAYYHYDEDEEFDDKPMALYLYNDEAADIFCSPNSIEEIADMIFDLIADDDNRRELKNRKLYLECKKEIKVRAKEINENYVEVFWRASNDSIDEAEPEEDEETTWEFYYRKMP